MKRFLPTNICPSHRGNISVLTFVLLITITTTGCAPRMAPVNTNRVQAYYPSQSTISQSEKSVLTEIPEVAKRKIAPNNISYRNTKNSRANKAKQNINYDVKDTYNVTAPAEIAPRATGIPKVNAQSISKIQNLTFVTKQLQSTPDQTVIATSTPSKITAKKQGACTKKERNKQKEASKAKLNTITKTSYSDISIELLSALEELDESYDSPKPTDTLPTNTTDQRVTDLPSTPSFFGMPTENSNQSTARQSTTTTPPAHNFKSLEIEHVKYSYYDPFDKDNNRFVVVLNEQRFCYPISGKYLSGYGYRGRSMHTGMDIKGQPNDTIYAVFSGIVRMSKPYSSYGNCIVLRHNNGLETLYGHNDRNLVKVGDRLQPGDPIAIVGRTGRASTEHCHFEVRVQGQHINPALILNHKNRRLQDGVLVVIKQSGGKIVATNSSLGMAPSATNSTSTASIHTVTSGDTLSGIAQRHRTTVTKICALNNISTNAILSLGQKLTLR